MRASQKSYSLFVSDIFIHFYNNIKMQKKKKKILKVAPLPIKKKRRIMREKTKPI